MHDFSYLTKDKNFVIFKKILPDDLIIEEIEFKDDTKNELTKK